MMKGRVVIDFEADEEGECNFNIEQQGKDTLDNENLIPQFEYVIRELMQNK